MNCKHIRVEGKTTKYFVCGVKNKAIDEYECKKCMLKLPDYQHEFEQIFGKGFKRS